MRDSIGLFYSEEGNTASQYISSDKLIIVYIYGIKSIAFFLGYHKNHDNVCASS